MRLKSESISHLVMSTSLWPHGMWTVACQAPPLERNLQATILEWLAFPFSRGSSQHGDWIQVSCIADRFFTVWATRKIMRLVIFVYCLMIILYVLLHKKLFLFLNIQVTEIYWMCPFNPQHLWEKILKARSSHWTVYVCDNSYNVLIGREKHSWSIDTKAFSSSALTSIYGNVLNL